MKILVTGGSGFIGKHLCELLKQQEFEVLNVDIEEPIDDLNEVKYKRCSILDELAIMKIFAEFQPNIVYHLAAKADLFGKSLADYEVNIQGTANILNAIMQTDSVEHSIITSTQLVIGPKNSLVAGNGKELYDPLDQLYSLSKVKTEKLTKEILTSKSWTIVRPTNIWGEYHPRFPTQIWKYIKNRQYVHPLPDVTRSYGYVKNVAAQMLNVIRAPKELVDNKIFYVGDESIESLEWIDRFSLGLSNKKCKKVHKSIFFIFAVAGETLNKLGVNFPLNFTRYKSMTSDYVVPMENTFAVLGKGEYSLDEAVTNTIQWYLNHD